MHYSGNIPTPWTCLACEVRLYLLDEDSFPFSHMFPSLREGAARNAVHFLSALLAPFSFMLPDVELLYGDIGVEIVDGFVGYLPNCSNITTLLNTLSFLIMNTVILELLRSTPIHLGLTGIYQNSLERANLMPLFIICS